MVFNGVLEAIAEPTIMNVLAAGIGVVPIVGDFGAKLIKRIPDNGTVKLSTTFQIMR